MAPKNMAPKKTSTKPSHTEQPITTAQQKETITGEDTRKKPYKLDKSKALEKKLEACGRGHIKIKPIDEHNYVIEFSAAFSMNLPEQRL
jgi:hypothetical protein